MRFKGLPDYDTWRRNGWGFGPWRRFVYWWCNGPVGEAASAYWRSHDYRPRWLNWTHGTSKGYKHYMEPPNKLSRQIYDSLGAPVAARTGKWSPAPPVKLYTYHFSEAQIDRLNALARQGSHP